MRRLHAILLLALLLPGLPGQVGAQTSGPDFAGEWRGALEAGPRTLTLVFHLAAGEAGLEATMDSPMQGAFGVPFDRVAVSGDTLVLELSAAGARFRGVLADSATLAGTWSQGSVTVPLTMRRGHASPAEGEGGGGADLVPPADTPVPDPSTRPQTPRPPFPYQVEEVTVPRPDAGLELAGTLTLPRGPGSFPGVVLVTGSGPQDRDETVLGHKPFAVLADYLTRRGIAVLRYDDRGVGESTGSHADADSPELAGDAAAVLRALAGHPSVDPARVGVIGHSEGGLIAPMVARDTGLPAFVVLLAGPGLPGDEIILAQSRLIATAQGVDSATVAMSLAVNRALFGVVSAESDPETARRRMRSILNANLDGLTSAERAAAGIPDGAREAWVESQVRQLTDPWFRFFLAYDPAPALEALQVPILAVNGSLDLQVPAGENMAAIEAALARGGNDDVTTRVFPGLNHLFQTAETGTPDEYARIPETMSPAVLESVGDWIVARFGETAEGDERPAGRDDP